MHIIWCKRSHLLSPTKFHPTLLVQRPTFTAIILHAYAPYAKKQHKSTGNKAVSKMLVKSNHKGSISLSIHYTNLKSTLMLSYLRCFLLYKHHKLGMPAGSIWHLNNWETVLNEKEFARPKAASKHVVEIDHCSLVHDPKRKIFIKI